jgi:hypothetical protein
MRTTHRAGLFLSHEQPGLDDCPHGYPNVARRRAREHPRRRAGTSRDALNRIRGRALLPCAHDPVVRHTNGNVVTHFPRNRPKKPSRSGMRVAGLNAPEDRQLEALDERLSVAYAITVTIVLACAGVAFADPITITVDRRLVSVIAGSSHTADLANDTLVATATAPVGQGPGAATAAMASSYSNPMHCGRRV